jgi:DNA-directed RNA polymerase specialized sigma24 family protein
MPSNARLIERCQDGNQAAWSTLVNRYERLVYGVALGEGLQSEIAAEVAQHTFVELHRCLTAIREPERLAGWLTVVCRRESWRQRSRVLPTVELREEELSPHPDFAEPYANAVVLYDAIQSLAEPCRSLILGLFFDPDEPDYASLAVALGRPVGSIGPMRGRCLEQLREILDSSRMAVFDNE